MLSEEEKKEMDDIQQALCTSKSLGSITLTQLNGV